MLNTEIARRLEEVADLLERHGANSFRVRSYRRAALGIRRLPRSLAEICHTEGEDGLRAAIGVGERLSKLIQQLIVTGRLPMLDRLRGAADPVAVLETVPGIGPVLANHLYEDLGIDSLEDLETAAHDGRLTNLAGIGSKKLAGIEDTMSARLGRLRPASEDIVNEPSVEELLDVDREYRQNAAAGTLPKIAPRRFNPKREQWLAVLRTDRGGHKYTALFSNTARAHELGRTRDWVVLYYNTGANERQATVLTSHRGNLGGMRIVRGREAECEQYYRSLHRLPAFPLPAASSGSQASAVASSTRPAI
jgi:DNA polymerase (family X)